MGQYRVMSGVRGTAAANTVFARYVPGRRLDASFFRRDVVTVSKELLGKVLVSTIGGKTVRARIVETEAYAQHEKACHAHLGRRTTRTDVMFRAGGALYVYLCYGMHHMINIVTGEEGTAEAVLVRAAEPVEGSVEMMVRRKVQMSECKRVDGLTRADYDAAAVDMVKQIGGDGECGGVRTAGEVGGKRSRAVVGGVVAGEVFGNCPPKRRAGGVQSDGEAGGGGAGVGGCRVDVAGRVVVVEASEGGGDARCGGGEADSIASGEGGGGGDATVMGFGGRGVSEEGGVGEGGGCVDLITPLPRAASGKGLLSGSWRGVCVYIPSPSAPRKRAGKGKRGGAGELADGAEAGGGGGGGGDDVCALPPRVTNGPGSLSQALGVTTALTGSSLNDPLSVLWVEEEGGYEHDFDTHREAVGTLEDGRENGGGGDGDSGNGEEGDDAVTDCTTSTSSASEQSGEGCDGPHASATKGSSPSARCKPTPRGQGGGRPRAPRLPPVAPPSLTGLPFTLLSGPRVGVAYAGRHATLPWRFRVGESGYAGKMEPKY